MLCYVDYKRLIYLLTNIVDEDPSVLSQMNT